MPRSQYLLGNRTWENYGLPSVKRFVYDELNRATSITGAQDGARYVYRADGMRVQKISGLSVAWNPSEEEKGSGWYDENWTTNKATSRYFYDGQMNFEEDFKPAQGSTGSPSVTRYGLGARGIDYVEKTVGTGTADKAYPVYDTHGNMVATINLSGSLSNQRTYDMWGGVRAQNGVSSNPDNRYVG